MSGTPARSLEEWIRFLATAADRETDRSIVGGSWLISGSTPPPVPDPPITRYPLERALEILDRVGPATAPGRSRDLHRRALAWLDAPHPAASAWTRRRMDQLRSRCRDPLRDGDR